MKRILLFGATGNLGKEIAKELVGQGYDLTVAIRNIEKAKALSHITSKYIVVDVCNSQSFSAITDPFEVIISALGKSVSPNDKSKPSFKDVDLDGNTNILNFALNSNVEKFVYVSAFHSEKYRHLEYFRVHHEFSQRLIESGLNYSIIKPPAIFCAFLDMIAMAKKGQLVNIGKGDKTTNPIYEGDLAKIVVNSIKQNNVSIGAGGKKVYTRKELNEIINRTVNGNKKLRTLPMFILKTTLPLIKAYNRNSYDKFAFFLEVMKHDTIAPQVGEKSFEDYVNHKFNNENEPYQHA